jgi:NAD(P)-dependent dehydrogenase (short-subunit alcohol dehydrogenase family)
MPAAPCLRPKRSLRATSAPSPARREVAARVNDLGRFDAVIHNAAVGFREGHRLTDDGLPHVFAINTLSAYILTALIERPKRLVYLSSGMHHHANANLDDILWKRRRWNGATAYAESKLHDVMLAFAIARRWPGVLSNALEPGWVPTKMGGADAPDDMDQAHLTQAWLAGSDAPEAKVTGRYRRTGRRPARGSSGSGVRSAADRSRRSPARAMGRRSRQAVRHPAGS